MLEVLTKAAEQGDAEAQNELGVGYLKGTIVPQDYQKAVELFTKAAEQGNALAQSNLGDCYAFGHGVPQDFSKAIEWRIKAAEQGNAGAQYNLAICYFNGEGVPKDQSKAVEWFTKSAEQGNADAQKGLGISYFYGYGIQIDYDKAVKWFAKAAEQGIAPAQYFTGVCYEEGKGVTQDTEKALKWYRLAADQGENIAKQKIKSLASQSNLPKSKLEVSQANAKSQITVAVSDDVQKIINAAESGDAHAQYKLGDIYKHGGAFPKNMEKAAYWYTKAAEQGDVDAVENLMLIYKHDLANTEGARNWHGILMAMATRGHPHAQELLATMEEYDGNEQRAALLYAEAARGYTNSAQQGNALAMCRLGEMYKSGNKGVEENSDLARRYITAAAELGEPRGQFRLGYEYGPGYMFDDDPKMSFLCYTKSAEQGYAESYYYLADCYACGNGTPKDMEKANYWYTKSAELGCKSSQYKLGVNYAKGNGVPKDIEKAKYWITLATEGYVYEKEAKKALAKLNAGKPIDGCYVATCVYGSYDCPEVWTLRHYRDSTLSASWFGRRFIQAYYAVSPKIVALFGNQKWFVGLCKPIIDKIICRLQKA